jgi:hypothetical protein
MRGPLKALDWHPEVEGVADTARAPAVNRGDVDTGETGFLRPGLQFQRSTGINHPIGDLVAAVAKPLPVLHEPDAVDPGLTVLTPDAGFGDYRPFDH